METNVQTDKKGKKNKKHEAEAQTEAVQGTQTAAEGEAVAEADAAVDKAKGAPRPRRWDYGIIDEATIERIAENPPVRKDIAEAWVLTAENPTVAEFMAGFASKTDGRHCLRVMSRRKLIAIVHADGARYPVAYEPAVATEAPAEAATTEAAPAEGAAT